MSKSKLIPIGTIVLYPAIGAESDYPGRRYEIIKNRMKYVLRNLRDPDLIIHVKKDSSLLSLAPIKDEDIQKVA